MMGLKVEKHIINQNIRATISQRYKKITQAVNKAFWNSTSETEHSFYVGSYGRGTAIKTSDLDVLIQLPYNEFEHYSSQIGNGQSRLLQVVKNAILSSYPRTEIKGDGQVVVVDFSDGIKFEILPAFKSNYNETYTYPNTHMGGNWLSTNPKAEIHAMEIANDEQHTNGLLFATCQHIRYLRDEFFFNRHLSGILIDSFVFKAIGGWHYLRDGEVHTHSVKTYEEHLKDAYDEMTYNGRCLFDIVAPGSRMKVDSSKDWETLGKILEYMC